MLTVIRRTALVLGDNNPLDRREIELGQSVVLCTEKASSPSMGLDRVDPTVHDPPADECLYPLRPVRGMKQQSVHIVRAIIDGQPYKWHYDFSS
jgi:hypothetical protein